MYKNIEIKKDTVLRAGVVAGGLGLTALLAGCSEGPTIYEDTPATVISHIYDDADDTFVMAGKVPVFIHEPEVFYLEVQQCERHEDDHADERGCVTARLEVSAETYQAYADGSEITFTE